jgi:hypothetical protein
LYNVYELTPTTKVFCIKLSIKIYKFILRIKDGIVKNHKI